jgi:HNH endonuclease
LNDEPCLEWAGARNRKGYGIWPDARSGRTRIVHRRVWEDAHGPVPRGRIVMHTCDNPPCYRLSHLRLGTVAENQRDMVEKGRSSALTNRERCISGRHLLAEVGWYEQKNGKRVCKACHAERQRRWRAKR